MEMEGSDWGFIVLFVSGLNTKDKLENEHLTLLCIFGLVSHLITFHFQFNEDS